MKAGFTQRSTPQNTIGLMAWLTIGIIAGLLATLHFMLLLRAHIYLAIRQMRMFRNARGFGARAYVMVWFSHFAFSYLNMFGAILSISTAWVYPVSFPFFREFYGGIMDGASHGNIPAAIVALLILSGGVMSFVTGVVGIVKFVRKLRKKQRERMRGINSNGK